MMLIAMLAAAGGPIAWFETRAPKADYVSRAAAPDVERCLLDIRGFQPPLVYRQPDRPRESMLIWMGGIKNGSVAGRVDLSATESGTHVRSWMDASLVEACAPR